MIISFTTATLFVLGPNIRVIYEDVNADNPKWSASNVLSNDCDYNGGESSNLWEGEDKQRDQSFILERCDNRPIRNILLRNSRNAQYNDR